MRTERPRKNRRSAIRQQKATTARKITSKLAQEFNGPAFQVPEVFLLVFSLICSCYQRITPVE
jgi:hypothetical protein